MKLIFTYLLLTGLAYSGHAQNTGLSQLDFFIGEWDLKTTDITRDRTFVDGRAKSIVKYMLGGKAIQDDFHQLDANGQIVFSGTSIRSYNPTKNIFQIVWIMPGVNGITDITADMKDNKLVGTGRGYDDMGEFVERFEYFDITENSYSFKLDRSYDGGNYWINNFSRIQATRVK